MTIYKTCILLLSTVVFLTITESAEAQKKSYKSLSEKIEQYRNDWDVPGVAVAIIQNDEIVYSKGFGELEKGKSQVPDGQSVFAVASISKAFTAAALAMMVDEGKLSWNDKVVTWLPWFKLYDPWVTQQMTVEDLLTHRSGLATFSGDLLWHASTHSMEEVVKRAQHLEPVFEFRDGYGYQNIMYVAAGLILEKVSGMSWQEFVQQRILNPLGMERTFTSVNALSGVQNVAQPHSGQPGDNVPIPYINWDNMAPAGALLSTTEDLCKWMSLQMNRGVYQGDTLFSEDRWREMWTVHNPQAVSSFAEKNYPGYTFSGYGLGWVINTYRDKKIVSHSGGYDGMISKLTMIPDLNAGFVVLTNTNTVLPHVLHHTLMDLLIGGVGSDKDWSAFFLPMIKGREEGERQRVQGLEALRQTEPNHSLPLSEYAASYGGEMYGNTRVWLENDTLRFQMEPTPLFSGWLEPMNFDTFILKWDHVHMLPVGTAQFIINGEGKTEELILDVPNGDFWFYELDFKRID